ncbi:MAG TPA: hypothetical protein VLF91_06590 [Candidatus Saccharimonadales bacterium]|nr:hypothetical protein [Candidatus Saccharimonadales bacterium]
MAAEIQYSEQYPAGYTEVEGVPHHARVFYEHSNDKAFTGGAEVHIEPPFTASSLFYEAFERSDLVIEHYVTTVGATVLLFFTEYDDPEDYDTFLESGELQAVARQEIVQIVRDMIDNLNNVSLGNRTPLRADS